MCDKERIRAACVALDRVSDTSVFECVHWIGGADEGIDWCKTCATKEIKRLQVANPKTEYFLDGGYDFYHTSDGVAACGGCGQPLGYSLTRYGATSEIDHFLEYGVLVGGSFSNIVAFEIAAALSQAEYMDDPEVVSDALRIGETAVQLIGYDQEVSRFADDGGRVA